jgi:outer membrane biosynthesis protein TonB
MSAPLASDRGLGLVFAWDHPRQQRLAITGFLAGSLALHAFCFYLFQIIYPPAVALLPPPGRVTVIAPNTEEGRVLLRWLEAEDPALASTTQPPAGGKSLAMPTIQHAPSYLTRQPALKEIPPFPPDPAVPSAQPPAPVALPHTSIPTVGNLAPTRVRWSQDLEALGTPHSPEVKFTATGRESPQAAEFRIAADGNGTVRYCFVEKSSGDAALDEQARKHLALTRFSASRQPQSEIRKDFIWGTATVEWGNDIVAAAPPAESVAP